MRAADRDSAEYWLRDFSVCLWITGKQTWLVWVWETIMHFTCIQKYLSTWNAGVSTNFWHQTTKKYFACFYVEKCDKLPFNGFLTPEILMLGKTSSWTLNKNASETLCRQGNLIFKARRGFFCKDRKAERFSVNFERTVGDYSRMVLPALAAAINAKIIPIVNIFKYLWNSETKTIV